MKELKAAFPETIPVLAGYVFLGITYGILMVTNGFPVYLPVLTALGARRKKPWRNGNAQYAAIFMRDPCRRLLDARSAGSRRKSS